MWRKKNADGWTWTPAEEVLQRRRQAIGGLVLAVACLSLGIFIGRVSTSDLEVATAPQSSAPPPQPHAEAPPEPPPRATPAPSTAQAPKPSQPAPSTAQGPKPASPEPAAAQAPSLALGSDQKDTSDAAKVTPAPADPPVLLNPGTAGPRSAAKAPPPADPPASADPPVMLKPEPPASRSADEQPARWKRSLAKRRLTHRPSRPVERRAASGSSRNYQGLRDYVLNK